MRGLVLALFPGFCLTLLGGCGYTTPWLEQKRAVAYAEYDCDRSCHRTSRLCRADATTPTEVENCVADREECVARCEMAR